MSGESNIYSEAKSPSVPHANVESELTSPQIRIWARPDLEQLRQDAVSCSSTEKFLHQLSQEPLFGYDIERIHIYAQWVRSRPDEIIPLLVQSVLSTRSQDQDVNADTGVASVAGLDTDTALAANIKVDACVDADTKVDATIDSGSNSESDFDSKSNSDSTIDSDADSESDFDSKSNADPTSNLLIASKFLPKHIILGSNAITILNHGSLLTLFNFTFQSQLDWSRIRVPYANLNFARLFRCNLNHADLSHAQVMKVDFRDATALQINLDNSIADVSRSSMHWRYTSVVHSPNQIYIAYLHESDMMICHERNLCGSPVRKFTSNMKFHPQDTHFSLCSKMIAYRVQDGIEVKSVQTGTRIALVRIPSFHNFIGFTSQGDALIVMESPATTKLTIRAIASGEVLREVCGEVNHSQHTVATLSEDRKEVVMYVKKNLIQIWSIETGELLAQPELLEATTPSTQEQGRCKYKFGCRTQHVHSIIRMSPDGRILLYYSKMDEVHLWRRDNTSTHNWRLVGLSDAAKKHFSSVAYLCFSPDSSQVAVYQDRGMAYILDATTLESHMNMLIGIHTDFAFSLGGDKLYVFSGPSSELEVWSVPPYIRTYTRLNVSHNPAALITCNISMARISPDGTRIAACSRGSEQVPVWSIASRRCIGLLTGHTAPVTCLDFSPDGSKLASGCELGTIHLWDIATGSCLIELCEPSFMAVSALRFSPDGIRLVSCSEDRYMRVWDTSLGECIAEIQTDWPQKIAIFSRDAKTIYSTTYESGIVTAWSYESNVTNTLYSNVRGVNLSINQDGSKLLASCAEGSFTVLNLATSMPDKCSPTTFKQLFRFTPCGRFLMWVPADWRTPWQTFHLVAAANARDRDYMLSYLDDHMGLRISQAVPSSVFVRSIDFTPNSEFMVMAANDSIQVWRHHYDLTEDGHERSPSRFTLLQVLTTPCFLHCNDERKY